MSNALTYMNRLCCNYLTGLFRNPSKDVKVDLDWPRYNERNRPYMYINDSQRLVVQNFLFKNSYNFFNNFYYPSMECISSIAETDKNVSETVVNQLAGTLENRVDVEVEERTTDPVFTRSTVAPTTEVPALMSSIKRNPTSSVPSSTTTVQPSDFN